MQLALAAGTLDVDLMLNSISSEQFSEWQAFYQLFPFGAQAETHRFAVQQANIVNSPHYQPKKAFTPCDFMPRYTRKKQTTEQQIALFDQLG